MTLLLAVNGARAFRYAGAGVELPSNEEVNGLEPALKRGPLDSA
jgi:hypothetical protein